MPLFSCSSCSHLWVNMWVWTSMTVMLVSLCVLLRVRPDGRGGTCRVVFKMLNDPDTRRLRMKRRHFAALAGAALAAPAVLAQDRTIRIMVGFPPGGSADVIARLLSEKMRASLGQNVIVDNKPGAAGRLVLGELKRAAPDGQTLVLSPSGALVIAPWLYNNLPYDPIKDFTPIARVVTFDFAVTAGP